MDAFPFNQHQKGGDENSHTIEQSPGVLKKKCNDEPLNKLLSCPTPCRSLPPIWQCHVIRKECEDAMHKIRKKGGGGGKKKRKIFFNPSVFLHLSLCGCITMGQREYEMKVGEGDLNNVVCL